MAIVKPIKVRVGNLAGLRAVLDYIKSTWPTRAQEAQAKITAADKAAQP